MKTKILCSFLMLTFFSSANFAMSRLNTIGSEEKKSSVDAIKQQIITIEKDRVIKRANKLLDVKPQTVTAFSCPRSEGGKHDFFSEGPYWWPDKENPNGPYIRHDGVRNPDRFDHHDSDLDNFSWIVSSETSAYVLTRDQKYVKAALLHLNAWFVDTATRMNPSLNYAQAIKGVCSGRGIGIIDAVPLIDVAQSVMILAESPYASKKDISNIKDWFKQFIAWLNTHPYGIDEMNAENNHGTWWHTQVAAYARLVGDQKALQLCADFYKNKLIPKQMVLNGSFPLELERTNPYSYSQFNLEAMTSLAWSLSGSSFEVWNYAMPDGRGLNKGLNFIYPYLKDKAQWPYNKDIAHWENPPSARPFMLYAALALDNQEWFSLWKSLDEKSKGDASHKSMTFKNPIIYLNTNIKL